ncbi:hypothetical protein PG985_005033 [Apiospora marii]|uniref:uncharacterized protein n=1 Tax=Apiospora marii TaxID=335849 RepID=UPI00312F3076
MQVTPRMHVRFDEPVKVKEEDGEYVFDRSIPEPNQGKTPNLRDTALHCLSAITPEPSLPSTTPQKGDDGAGSVQRGLLPLTPKSIESRPRSNPLTEVSPTIARFVKETAPDEGLQQEIQGTIRTSIESDDDPHGVNQSKDHLPGEREVKVEGESTVFHLGSPIVERTGAIKRKYDPLDDEDQGRSRKQLRRSSSFYGKTEGEIRREKSVSEAEDDNDDDVDVKAESDLEGSDSEYDALAHWRREQIVLNAVLKGRDEFSLLPSTWKIHFLGAPVSDCMFYHQTKGMAARPRIYAHEDKYEVRGAHHLRHFIEVASRIRDLRTKQAKVARDKRWTNAEKAAKRRTIQKDMSRRIHKLLSDAIQWSWADGNLIAYKGELLPNIEIMDVSGSPDASVVDVENQLARLAERWRKQFDEREFKSLSSHPEVPVIYGFVILGSSMIIVSLDAANSEAKTHTPLTMNMAEAYQEGWNALGIMVTICWARDMLMRLREDLGLTVRIREVESDPDA